MSLVKCKCGRYTQNGFLCTSCQKDSSIDLLYYTPDDVEDEDEFDEYGFLIIDSLGTLEGLDDGEEEED
jgi:acyl carrier protein